MVMKLVCLFSKIAEIMSQIFKKRYMFILSKQFKHYWIPNTQSILDWKISIALEIFNRHLKSCKFQSIFQVVQE